MFDSIVIQSSILVTLLSALLVMVAAVLMQHLGLSEAIADVVTKVIAKIASCPQCLTFWCVLFAEYIIGTHPLLTLVVALVMSYLANWFLLVLAIFQRIFTQISQKMLPKNRGIEEEQEKSCK